MKTLLSTLEALIAVAKLYSYWIVKNYREAYNIYTCNGILFNHSSPRRPENFILKKITSSVKKYKNDPSFVLTIGNLDSKRDIGFAKEYCEGMWRMLQQDEPDDFVLATGQTYSIRQLIQIAYKMIDIEIVWKGKGINEKGFNKLNNNLLIEVDEKYFRPTEVDLLIGDPKKANDTLGWSAKHSIQDLITLMLNED